MNTERVAAIVGVVVTIFLAGAGWDSLSNRIDKVDEKIGAIQKTLGSTPCTAILNRQLAAIDKGRADVRKALDGLSDQYGCLGVQGDVVEMVAANAAAMTATNAVSTASNASQLNAQLHAVDAQLNKDH